MQVSATRWPALNTRLPHPYSKQQRGDNEDPGYRRGWADWARLLLALETDAAVGQAFAIGGKDQPTTSEAIVPYLSQKLGVPYVEASLPGIPTHYQHELTKTFALLGYRPEYDVFRMIDEAIPAGA